MLFILISLVFLVLTVTGHVGWCRRHRADRLCLRPFLVCAALGLGASALLLGSWPVDMGTTAAGRLWTLPLRGSALLLQFLLVAGYFIFYFSAMVESPTRRIIRIMESADGVSLDDLIGQMSNASLLEPRLQDLLAHAYVRKEGERYVLMPRGQGLSRVLAIYEWILRRPMGG